MFVLFVMVLRQMPLFVMLMLLMSLNNLRHHSREMLFDAAKAIR